MFLDENNPSTIFYMPFVLQFPFLQDVGVQRTVVYTQN